VAAQSLRPESYAGGIDGTEAGGDTVLFADEDTVN